MPQVILKTPPKVLAASNVQNNKLAQMQLLQKSIDEGKWSETFILLFFS